MIKLAAATVLLAGVGTLAASTLMDPPATQAGVMTVYKSPTCGCCSKWIDHMKAAGFSVRAVDLEDLTEVKQSSGVPMRLRTCHTALIDGYVVEGHVPADVVKKFLAEKPAAAGIVVPGMPIGSPGMEGTPVQAYEVLTFTKDGKTAVYARR